jgi:hypothetical protein
MDEDGFNYNPDYGDIFTKKFSNTFFSDFRNRRTWLKVTLQRDIYCAVKTTIEISVFKKINCKNFIPLHPRRHHPRRLCPTSLIGVRTRGRIVLPRDYFPHTINAPDTEQRAPRRGL